MILPSLFIDSKVGFAADVEVDNILGTIEVCIHYNAAVHY